MTQLTLTKTRLFEGKWEGIVTTSGGENHQPKIEVTHLGEALPGIEVTEDRDKGEWQLVIPVPVTSIGEGAHVFLIQDSETGETLESFSVIAGEAIADDMRAEVELLREELDMLKRAFRRHCLETM
ncbi:hypothetical protein DI396_12515 [Litorivita pollutaquae]|uniref:Uncharacterized protein n=1 Tax=Litorivita pollutaquae TaxID=2200892 RepID=A0A2V4MNA5_9RHOB|nr:hypothetical protein [Litorivita pollutaquae]OUS19883.1 hypothetical protein A9Q95_12720 [Rhodobacterales bacterium 59_46_T64]PYC47029.1 hypothetical protein DI396_12515 [Litorivita pollutaquae]